jgi:uncharacterized protein (DUF1499 family)
MTRRLIDRDASATPVAPTGGRLSAKTLIKAVVLPGLLMGALTGCAGTTGPGLDPPDDQTLPPCPATPNCVSSDATDGLHRIEPLAIGKDPDSVWQALVACLGSDTSFTIKVQNDRYLRVEARTAVLGFVDDVQFQLRPDQGYIAMRSASRLGLSDLGANRRRLEGVRKAVEGN